MKNGTYCNPINFSLAAIFIGLILGVGYKASMKVDYPYDTGVAIDAPLTKQSMEKISTFVNQQCPIQDNLIYYLYTAGNYQIEALSLSDYNYLRQLLELEPIRMKSTCFMIHCDIWNFIDAIQQALDIQPVITLAGKNLSIAEPAIMTEPIEQYQMAGTYGYVLIVPDEIARQLSADKIRIAMKLKDGGFPELRSELQHFFNSNQ